MTEDEQLEEIKSFFDDRIFGWMIADLKKSVVAGTNYLTALGCLSYTEAIGAFLPPIEGETGRNEERRFYRCLFRLPSASALIMLDNHTRKETTNQKGLYQHLRHSGAHAYTFHIKKRADDGSYYFYPVAIAKNGTTPEGSRAAPMGIDEKDGYFVIATNNYVEELDQASRTFIEEIYVKRTPEWVKSAKNGINFLVRGV